MRDYFARLKTHSGLRTATFMTALGFLAGASNKSATTWYIGGLFVMLAMGIFVEGNTFITF